MKLSVAILALLVITIIVVAGIYVGSNYSGGAAPKCNSGSSNVVQVVAAENFWGSLVSQIGGTHVSVLSIVKDPNADPHEYEASAADARAVSSACLVIVNGAGYDTWALSLIAAAGSANQVVLNVQELIGQQVGANPHFWYSPCYVNDTVKAMYKDLVSIDPNDAAYYKQQYAALNSSLGVYNGRIHEIAQGFAGAKVAATEDIFVYLANATRLDLISPPEFMGAVAEGNDPPASSIAQFQQQLQQDNVTMLVYNEQTVTPLTSSMKALAAQENIPTVGVTETIQPPDASFQEWMNGELLAIQNALNATALGQ